MVTSLRFYVLVSPNRREESLFAVLERSFDNAAFSRPARHEHCPCYVRPFAVGINFVEPAFARSEIKVNLYLACLIAALSNPADFVALLARDDNVRCCFGRSQRYSPYKRGSKSVRAVLHLITANVANDSFNAKFFTIIFSVITYAL